jgi:beta-glucosidase
MVHRGLFFLNQKTRDLWRFHVFTFLLRLCDLLVLTRDYRYDANSIEPLFPFGHGLSYTSFTYSNLQATNTQVSCDITNSGKVAGAEGPVKTWIVVIFEPLSSRPIVSWIPFECWRTTTTSQRLSESKFHCLCWNIVKYSQLTLAPGAKQTVTFTITDNDKSIWNVPNHNWEQVKGTFAVHVGSSSRDIRLKGSFVN